MNRTEFIEKLKELLSDISESEREEAINYYEDYFDDVGEENEQQVISSLGSPERVAKTIKDGLNDREGEQGEFSETGFSGYGDQPKDEVGHREKRKFSDRLKEMGTAGIVLLLLIGIVALPVLGPILLGIVAVIFALIAVVVALIFSIAVAGAALVIGGGMALVLTIPNIVWTPAFGIALLGAAFVIIGIGILLTIAGIWIIWKVFPPIIRGIVSLLQKIFGKKGA